MKVQQLQAMVEFGLFQESDTVEQFGRGQPEFGRFATRRGPFS